MYRDNKNYSPPVDYIESVPQEEVRKDANREGIHHYLRSANRECLLVMDRFSKGIFLVGCGANTC